MYDKVIYLGKTLKDWCVILHNAFSIGELYRLSSQNVDFYKFI